MLLPDTTAFATEFMTTSWGYNQGSKPEIADEVISNAQVLAALCTCFTAVGRAPRS